MSFSIPSSRASFSTNLRKGSRMPSPHRMASIQQTSLIEEEETIQPEAEPNVQPEAEPPVQIYRGFYSNECNKNVELQDPRHLKH